ncbi:MAG: arginine--tRNA ligase [Nanoarchaeota archaeon]|nr:arginine--tRNA ligase [Nanoarchaeota archaeon]
MELAVKQLKELLSIDESKISTPPDSSMGDYSTTIAFDAAKESGENPNIAAIKIMSKLDLSKTLFSTVKAYGPYINFFLDKEKVINHVLKSVLKEKEKYESAKPNKQVVLLEFPSPNTNKPLHLGHVKNMSLGLSMSRVFENQGFNVKRINLYNDRGIHICKSMLAYEKWGRNRKPKIKTDHFVGDYYVMFAKKKSEKLEEEAKEMLKKWEEGDEKVLALWKKMNNWAYKGIEQTFKRFGLEKYDKVYYESKFYKQGKDIISEGLSNGVFEKEDGAVYADLGSMGKKYLVRGDGTALYATQDIALAKLKYKDYKFDKSIHIVGNEQNQYFQQLFKIFELLKYPFAGKVQHMNYGMVSLPSGKMKSREGTVVDADDLMDDMSKMAGDEVKKRRKKPDKKISELVGLAAIKYYLLKTTRHKDVVFNPEESISFEGNTGPYLLYSLVRAFKILKKNKSKLISIFKPSVFETGEEFKLVKDLAGFSEAVNNAEKDLSPHHLCNYAYNLAGSFNAFYDKCQVLSVEEADLKKARLLLVKAFSIVMSKVLYLLGIEPVKQM